MRKPAKLATVKGKINAYAYKVGFTYHPKHDGTVSLFDIRANYYVFHGSADNAARFVHNEMWMEYYRSNPS